MTGIDKRIAALWKSCTNCKKGIPKELLKKNQRYFLCPECTRIKSAVNQVIQ